MQLHRWQEVAEAISSMAVRGAPAIGIAAAWGVVLAAHSGDDLPTAIRGLRASRPTAVNLGWALNRMQAAMGSAAPVDVEALAGVAAALQQEDCLLTQRLVDHGVSCWLGAAVFCTIAIRERSLQEALEPPLG